MPTTTTDARFLGVNFHALWSDLRQAWVDFQNSAFLAWFTPEPSVGLYRADGEVSYWQGGRHKGGVDRLPKKHFTAIELPEDLILRRVLRLPALSATDALSAARLHTYAMSPFAERDLAWGVHLSPHKDGGMAASIVLASRSQISAYLQSQAQRPHFNASAELWSVDANGSPVVLQGYGEVLRQARENRMRGWTLGLLALAGALVVAIAITPTLQLRERALKAASAYESLVHRTAPLVKEREKFLQSVEKLNNLHELLVGRIEPLRVLERLTQVMPDDSALQSFSLKGSKVTLAGLTGNASVLMQLLGEQPGIRDVRAPSAAIRVGGDTAKENFVIEFSLDAAEFGMVSAVPLAGKAQGAVFAQPPAPPATLPVQSSAKPAGNDGRFVQEGGITAAPNTSSAQPPAPSFGGGARQSRPATPVVVSPSSAPVSKAGK